MKKSSSRFKSLAAWLPRGPQLREEGMFNIAREVLSNGLRVWSKARPGTSTVALLLQVPVGSRHETKANNGISHFLEHMLFTGTSRWSEQEVTEIIRRRGGELNARTGREETIFWLHLKAEDLDLGLEWLAEVIFRSTLAEDKFNKERSVIIAEKGGNFGKFEAFADWIEDSGLGWNVFRAIRGRLFPESSLLLPVIGQDGSLSRLRRQDVMEFYRRHYVPNSMTLVVVGDVDTAEVHWRARHYFAGIPKREPPPKPASPPPPAGGFNLRLHGPSINDQGQLLLGAPLPGLHHPDRWSLAVLAEILDTTLTHTIRYKRGLVYAIDIYPALYTDVGYFVMYTTAESEHFSEILREVDVQIGKVMRGEIDRTAVEEAKSALRGRLLLGMESNMELAEWLAGTALFLPDDRPLPDPFSEIARVTPADVQRMARTYLSPEQRCQAIHRPSITPSRLAQPALLGAGIALASMGLWLVRRNRRH